MAGNDGALVDPCGTVHFVRSCLEQAMPMLFHVNETEYLAMADSGLTIEVARLMLWSVSKSITLMRKLSPTFPDIKGPGY